MTVYKVNDIILVGDIMINFMKHTFVISKIELACLVEAGKGNMIHKNRGSHGLALFLGGKRTIYFDNAKLHVTKNTVVYFPKGSNYTIKETEPSDCYAVNFQTNDSDGFIPFAFKIKNFDLFLQCFKTSQKCFLRKNVGWDSKIKSELYNIIYNMQSEFNLPYGNSSVIQPAIDFIHSNYYKEKISVAQLAELCKISTVHLNNTFIKIYTMPPNKYINTLRMNRAKELLASQMYTVREVCFMSGFNDESYFSREFKKWFNISPNQFKREL